MSTIHKYEVEFDKQGHALILFGGGQDSTAVYLWARTHCKRVDLIHFNYGQKAWQAEHDFARHLVSLFSDSNLISLDIRSILPTLNSALLTGGPNDLEVRCLEPNEAPPSFLPGRNLLLISIAAAHCRAIGADVLMTGINQGPPSSDSVSAFYPDCSEDFARHSEAAVSLAFDNEIEAAHPVLFHTKQEVAQMFVEFGQQDLFHKTMSCLNPSRHDEGWVACGVCDSCLSAARSL